MDTSNSSDIKFRDAYSLSTGARSPRGISVPKALERAVDELEVSGFDRAALSILASEGTESDSRIKGAAAAMPGDTSRNP
jgi:hypothetical protein